ncbi:MAG: hypothetical protein Kow0089_24600 [Desulfobulbaceae bacterium]
MRMLKTRTFFAALLVLAALAAVPPWCRAATPAMTIALPDEVVRRSLQDILPLNLEDTSRNIDGTLILQSISRLVMGENSAVLQGLLIGRNLSVITRVGDQDLRIRIGDLQLPLTCDLGFRFDREKKVLYVTPRLRRPASASLTDMAGSVLSVLTLFNNREYPVSLTSFKTLAASVGRQDIAVEMEPVDIRVTKRQLVVKMVPRLSKTD